MPATYLIKQMPTCIINYHTLVHALHRDKLDLHGLKFVFISYYNTHNRYKCFHLPTSKYYISMDVQFCKKDSYFYSQGDK